MQLSLPFTSEFHQCCTPSPSPLISKPEPRHSRKPAQYGMHRAAQVAGAFTVNYTYLMNAGLATFIKIIRDQVLQIPGGKIMQVENAVNGQRDRVIIIGIKCIGHTPGLSCAIIPRAISATRLEAPGFPSLSRTSFNSFSIVVLICPLLSRGSISV